MHSHKPHTHSSQIHKLPLQVITFPLSTILQAWARFTAVLKPQLFLTLIIFFPYCGRQKYWNKIAKDCCWSKFCFLPVCLCPYCPLWCAEISDFRECCIAVFWGQSVNFPPGCFFVHSEINALKCCLCLECFKQKIILSVLLLRGFWFCRVVFACVEPCFLQVMESTHINNLHMVSKATRGPLMNPHSTTMKEVTVIHFSNFKPVFLQCLTSLYLNVSNQNYCNHRINGWCVLSICTFR